jgi:hypothetical protein
MGWIDTWRSTLRRYLSIISGRAVYDGGLVYWRGMTFTHRGWVYAMPVPPGDRHYRVGLNCTRMLLPSTSECILVRPLSLDEVAQAGIVYGLVVESGGPTSE